MIRMGPGQAWWSLAIGACILWAAPLSAGGKKKKDESEELFASKKVLHFTIDLAPKELESLRREPRKYAKATVKVGDEVYKDVGIKLKGAAGSFRGIDDKPNVTLNMDKFNSGQLFHDMDKFHLANSLQDPSYLNELICGELFRAVGVPASRVMHATVTINGRKRGFYYLKEGYDNRFLKRHFNKDIGNFYDGGFLREIDQPLQVLHSKKGVKPHTELKELFKAAHEGDPKARFQKMEKLLDVDKFVSFLVMEAITWDWDGYPMNRNNYRVYHDPERNKIIFIPSGMDQMFHNPGGPMLPDFQGVVARQFIQTPEGRKLYLDRMDEVMRTIYKPAELTKRLDELQAVIQPALAAVDAGAGRDFPNHVNRLKGAIQQRGKTIEEQLKRLKK